MPSVQFKLFLAFALVLGLVASPALAQDDSGPVGVADLPACAQSCATTAASAASCATTDSACLCKSPTFTQATLNCANTPGTCGIEDRSSTEGVLDDMCPQQPDPTPPTTPLTTPTPVVTPTGTPTGATTLTPTRAATTNTPVPTPSTPAAPATTNTPTPAGTPPANTLVAPKPETTANANTNTPAPAPAAGAGAGTVAGTLGTGVVDPNAASSTVVIVNTVTLPQSTDITPSGGAMGLAISKVAFLPVVLSVVGGFLVL